MNGTKAARACRQAPVLAALLLYACLGFAEAPAAQATLPEADSAPSVRAEVNVTAILAYYGRLQTLTVAEIGAEKQRLEALVATGKGSAGDLLRLALLQSHQGATLQETKETAELLREYLRRAHLNAEQRHFADLLMQLVEDRESCQEQLREVRHQARGLQRKLDELTTIETNISHREGILSPSAP